MFDAIAPRYDLVNRVMTFGMDRGWRRTAVRSLALGPGRAEPGPGPGLRDRRPVPGPGRGRVPTGRRRPVVRDAGPRHDHLPAGAGRRPPAALPRRLRRRGHQRLRLAQLRRPRRLLRASWPGSCGRGAASRCSTWPSPSSRVLRFGHGVYFGHVVPRIGGLLSDAAAYRYLPRSVAYLPPVGVILDRLAEAGFGAIERQPLSGGITQLFTATRRSNPMSTADPVPTPTLASGRRRLVGPHRRAARRRAAWICWPSAAAPAAWCFGSGIGPDWPGGARRCGSPCPAGSDDGWRRRPGGRGARRHRGRRRGRPCPAAARSPSVPCRSTGRWPGSLVVPAVMVGPGRRRDGVAHDGRGRRIGRVGRRTACRHRADRAAR